MTRVLIVDDHEEVILALRALLESEEQSEVVGCATAGPEAVDKARALMPDLAIVDFSMPGMDGIDTAAGIREASPDTAVVILSVYDEGEHAERAREAGVRAWFPKNLPPGELLDRMRAVPDAGRTDL